MLSQWQQGMGLEMILLKPHVCFVFSATTMLMDGAWDNMSWAPGMFSFSFSYQFTNLYLQKIIIRLLPALPGPPLPLYHKITAMTMMRDSWRLEMCTHDFFFPPQWWWGLRHICHSVLNLLFLLIFILSIIITLVLTSANALVPLITSKSPLTYSLLLLT